MKDAESLRAARRLSLFALQRFKSCGSIKGEAGIPNGAMAWWNFHFDLEGMLCLCTYENVPVWSGTLLLSGMNHFIFLFPPPVKDFQIIVNLGTYFFSSQIPTHQPLLSYHLSAAIRLFYFFFRSVIAKCFLHWWETSCTLKSKVLSISHTSKTKNYQGMTKRNLHIVRLYKQHMDKEKVICKLLVP